LLLDEYDPVGRVLSLTLSVRKSHAAILTMACMLGHELHTVPWDRSYDQSHSCRNRVLIQETHTHFNSTFQCF